MHSQIGYTIYFVHIILAIALSMYKFYVMFNYYVRLGPIQAIVEFLQYSVSLFTYWTIIFDSIIQQKAHSCFWQILCKIDDTVYHQLNHTFLLFTLKFVEFFSIKIVTYAIRIMNNNVDVFSFAYAILFVLCQIREFYYIFCLEVVNIQLKAIHLELETMKMDFNTKFNAKRLKWIRNYFHYVYEMISCVNQTFGWSQIATFASSFYLVLTQSTWDYIYYGESSFPIRIGEN